MSKRKSTDQTILSTTNKTFCEDNKCLPQFSAKLRNVLQQKVQNKTQREYSLESFNQSDELQYQASGVKLALHGTVYQLKLLMLVLKRAFDEKQNFKLATELDDAEKFDDVVIQWENGSRLPKEPKKIYFQFLQAKHKSDDKEFISIQNLFSEKDDEAFSLQKYFKSYRKLKSRFDGACIEDIIICTNINFNPDLNNIILLPQPVQNMENIKIFHMSDETKTTLWNKIKWDTIPPERLEMFKNTSELRVLAKDLCNCIKTKGKVDFTNQLFKKYCHALASSVFDFTKMGFRDTFFTSLKMDVIVFRKALTESLQLSESDMREKIEKMSLNRDLLISADYIKYCVSSSVPQITDPVDLSKKMVAAMVAVVGKKNIRIEKRAKIIRENVASFPGNVFEVTTSGEIKFTKSFLDPMAILRGNVVQLRLRLQEEVTKCGHFQWNDLSNFTFSITDFPDIRSETYDDSFELPSSDIKLHEIEDFFGKLIFATNTPNESDLSAIIAEEFRNTLGVIGAKVGDLITGTFMESVLDWMKARDAHWLTQSKAQTYFFGLQQKISTLQLVGISLNSLKSFRNSGVECVNERNAKYFNLIDEFMASPSKLVLLITCESESSSWLNWLKLSTTFQQACETMLDITMYAPLSAIVNLKENVLLALKSASPFFLVCYCDVSFDKPGFEIFQRELNIYINKELLGQKKIILVMDIKKFDFFSNVFTAPHTTTISASDVCLNHLTENSKRHFLEKEVVFCGRSICLQKVLGSTGGSIFNSCEILKLCRSETIRIGGKLPTHAICYIERTLYRSVFSLERLSMLSDKNIIALSGVNFEYINVNRSVIYLSRTNPSVEYDECIQRNSEKSVHWLHQVDNTDKKLVHIRSSGPPGCVQNLKILLKEGHEHRIVETGINIDNCDENVCVLSAVPGMGKSETLKKLMEAVQRSDDGVFIIWLNLIDWTNDLKNITFDTISEVLDFLYVTQFLNTQFERDLLKLSLETSGRIYCFVDGFDEMIPDYEAQICKLFNILSNTKARKIYVSTRTSSVNVLEHRLNVSPYHMDAFSLDDQIRYISDYWKTELDALIPSSTIINTTHTKLTFLAQKLIHKFNELTLSKENIEFNGIPLQAQMLAVIYLPWVSEENPSFEDAENLKVDAYRLYRKFMEEKYSRYLSKIVKPTVPGAAETIADLRQLYDTRHEVLAFQEVFPLQAPYVIEAQNQNNEWQEGFKDVMAGIGIMYFSPERTLKFVHRTFSEFLAGVFLGKEAKNSTTKFKKFLTEQDMLWHPERRMIRYFFDRFLSEGADSDCHVAVLNQDAVTLSQLSLRDPNTWFTTLDSMGRSPIHLIASYGLRKLLQDNFRLYSAAFNIEDRLYGWKPVKYGAQVEDWSFTMDVLIFNTASGNQFSCKEKSSILLFAADIGLLQSLFDFWSAIETDETFGKIVLSVDREGYNVLHRVLQHGEERTSKFLLDNLKRYPLIFKSLLVTKDNSSSRLSPMFFLHREKRNKTSKEQKENYTKIVFQVIEDSMTPTDIKDVFLTTDAYNGTLVHYAAGLGNTLMLRKILEGLDEESLSEVFVWRNAANATPIEIAMQNGHVEAGHIFIEFDSPTTRLSKEEIDTLKHYVADNMSEYEDNSLSPSSSCDLTEEDILKNIEEKGMDEIEEYLTSIDNRLRTILHYAAEDGSTSIVTAILQKLNAFGKSDLITKLFQIQDDLGRIPFHLAAQDGHEEIINMMLSSIGENISIIRHMLLTIDKDRMSVIQMAAQNGFFSIVTSIVEYLLQNSCENESEDDKLTYLLKLFTIKDSNNGYTLLHEAITRQHESILEYTLSIFRNDPVKLMKLLLENTDLTFEEGENQLSPFLLSVRQNHINCFRIIIRHLNDNLKSVQSLITSESSTGLCALHYASCNGNAEFLEILLKCELDIKEKEAFINHKEQEGGLTPLHLACIEKQVESVQILLKFGANVDMTNDGNESPLHCAVQSGNLEITNLLIENKADIHPKSVYSQSLLDLAIIYKFPNIVKRLLEVGANAESVGFFGTPYYLACKHGSLEILKILLEKQGITSCNLALERLNWETPLHVAAKWSHNIIVQTVLTWVSKGLLIDPRDGDGFTPLCMAAANGDDAMVKLFLTNGANIEHINELGYSLLLLACKKSDNEMFKKLLENGASIYQESNAGITCLHFAAANGNLEIVRTCLSSRFDIDIETRIISEIDSDILDCLLPTQHRKLLLSDSNGLTISLKPLHIAAAWGFEDVCSELIKSGASTTSNVYPPIHAAAFAETADIPLLALFHRNEDSTDIFGRTLLHWTAISGNLENVGHVIDKSKIEKVKLFSKVDNDGRTPLHCAVAFGRTDVVSYLLQQYTEAGFEIGTMDNGGQTLLHTALGLNTTSGVDHMKLIDELWDRNKMWPSANNLLHCAMASGTIEILDHFLGLEPGELVKNLKSLDSDGNTPLIVASAKGFVKGCRNILEIGNIELDGFEFKRFVNKQNLKASTALHEAVKIIDFELVKLLLYYGADPTLENDENKSSLRLAEETFAALSNDNTDGIKSVLTHAFVAFKPE